MLGRRGFFGLLLGAGAGAVAGKLGAVKAATPKPDLKMMVGDYAIQPGRYLRMYCTTSGATVTTTATLQWSEDGETWEMRDNVTC